VNVKSLFLSLVVLLLPALADALGPHEVLVLAHKGSPGSLALARRYVEWRHIPPSNLVELDLPPEYATGKLAIGLAAFKSQILKPAVTAARDRGIDGHILAWVYSTDFPTRVDTPQPVSLTGATFLRGNLPVAEAILKADYVSPLFAGPERLRTTRSAAQTFDRYARWLGRDMPLPSMMLGYTGERGNTIDEVRAALWRGVQSDHTAPTGTIYFVTTGDVRSTCRAWQYEGGRLELARQGVRAVVSSTFPTGQTNVLGLMTGSASVKPERVGAYLPGAVADHLTSFGGAFDHASQTKMTAWIKAGATLTAGTVAEPRALYQKFPTARFYLYYAQGCTAIESFYQAVSCPFQILMLGDPLASPWAADDRLSIVGLPQEPVSEAFTLKSTWQQRDAMRFYSRNLWFLDGRPMGNHAQLAVDVASLKAGAHEVRVVAYSTGLVRQQVFEVERFEVK
jgi:uncharacterized protein (TIGR03790 family)